MEKNMIKRVDAQENTAEDTKPNKPMTVAEKIWNSIKNEKLEMFALPKQLVNMYCEPINIEPTKLYLKFTVPALLPALETALNDRYSVELVDKYICVSNIIKK